MKRRLGLAIAASLALAAGIAVGVQHHGSTAQAAAAPQRPNVLVLETDDQTLAEMAVLPNVRRLIGDQGVTFDNNFDSFSLCCPSRATFLTGQYSHNNNVRGNSPPQGGYQALDKSNTLAVWLQRGGYYTVHLGKFLNGYGRQNPTEIPPGWSEWHGSVDPTTYRYYNYTLNEGGSLHTFCATPQPSCYQTDVYRDKANEIIKRRATQGPFFLWVAFLGDHSGTPREPDDPPQLGTPVPAPRHHDALKGTPLPQPPSFNEADVSDKPQVIRRRPLLNCAPDRGDPGELATAPRDVAVRGRSDLVDRRDAAADRRARQHVDPLHVRQRFLPRGAPRRERQGALVRAVHPPAAPDALDREQVAAARRPSQPADDERRRRRDDPRRRERAGRSYRGRRLAPPLLARPGKEIGRDVLLDNSPGAGHFDGIRTQHYKYAEYANGDRELYDLRKDPDELQSQHANPAYDALKASLAARLHNLVSCSGASCRARPAVRFTAARRGRCGVVTATASGPGVQSATFLVNGRQMLTDSRTPFRARLLVKKRSTIRVRVSVAFDRFVTLDRTVRACS